MTAEQLDQIEVAVGFKLPAEYRRVALAFPFRPIGKDVVYWFYNKPDQVISETHAPLADGPYNKSNWQAGYLTIGNSAAGDPYLLDTTAPGLPVHCLSHETHQIEPEWPTFEAFVADWCQSAEELNRNLQMEEAARRRQTSLTLLILACSIGLPLLGLILLWFIRREFP